MSQRYLLTLRWRQLQLSLIHTSMLHLWHGYGVAVAWHAPPQKCNCTLQWCTPQQLWFVRLVASLPLSSYVNTGDSVFSAVSTHLSVCCFFCGYTHTSQLFTAYVLERADRQTASPLCSVVANGTLPKSQVIVVLCPSSVCMNRRPSLQTVGLSILPYPEKELLAKEVCVFTRRIMCLRPPQRRHTTAHV